MHGNISRGYEVGDVLEEKGDPFGDGQRSNFLVVEIMENEMYRLVKLGLPSPNEEVGYDKSTETMRVLQTRDCLALYDKSGNAFGFTNEKIPKIHDAEMDIVDKLDIEMGTRKIGHVDISSAVLSWEIKRPLPYAVPGLWRYYPQADRRMMQ